MGFVSTTLSCLGGRSENEDAAGAAGAAGFHCWAVADGLGGHAGGATAARIAVEIGLSTLTRSRSLDADVFQSAMERANATILANQNDSDGGGMSTLVLLATEGQKARWAHLGDTRLYHLRNGAIVARTRDHSVPELLFQAGEISEDEIRTHRDRNRLFRALGQQSGVEPTIAPPVSVVPGDVLLLCSDGWWESIPESDLSWMAASLIDATSRSVSGATVPHLPTDPQNAIDFWLEDLARQVRDRNPRDNYTATAILVI